MRTKILTSIILHCFIAFFPLLSKGQHTAPCGHDHVVTQWWNKHPKMKEQFEKTNLSRQKSSIQTQSTRNTKIIIPVVFHILHLNGPENISEAQIHDQVRILNRDYQKMNADTAQVVSAFQNIIANVDFEFQLASIDPDGNCTNGIVRHYTPKTTWNSSRLEDFTYTWPADKYMNIYIVKKIDIAPAYTFLPGIGIPDYADAIVCESWLVGSIGTATAANSRVLTHEIGHWFGLPHIWGVSNAPGVACGDDGVEDTPITKGFIACMPNNAKICDPNIVENVQNYMDYTPCKLMFTNGQAGFMRETITLGLNKRDHLVSEENLIATGIIGAKPCSTLASFYSVYSSICKGETIRFFDQSQAGPEFSSRAWYIPGGIPSFSQDSIVDITFAEAGEYEVKLIVSGPNGVDSLSRFVMVYDGNNGNKTPLYYSFDDGQIPSEIQVFNPLPSSPTWESLSSIGANGTDGCIFLNNDASPTSGYQAYFETPFFDFSANDKPNMSFYYAYARKTVDQMDTFRLEFTLDCGQSWKTFPGIPSTTIMANNSGGVSAASFFPQSSEQWKKLNLTSAFQALFRNKSSVKFRFYFGSDAVSNSSNNIFIDEINITNESISSLQQQDESSIQIYPNPATTSITIDINEKGKTDYELEVINSLGNNFIATKAKENEGYKTQFIINQDGALIPGVYMIKIKKPGFSDVVRKVVIV